MVNHRRGPWSQAEDSYLVQLVHVNGAHNWVRISSEIGSRSPKQCRERYHQNLKPTLNHDPISAEEGEQIERMVAEMGRRWAEIARRLNGRSDNAVKNWWNGGQNRRKRNPERDEPHGHEQTHAQYHYPEPPRPVQHSLPPLRDYQEPTAYYSQSRRTSSNPSASSPHAVKLPHPQGFEPYPGSFPASRPHPIEIPSFASRTRGYDTPVPSPGYAPSLVTDAGSDTRSPRGAPSPLDHSLPPMIGSRDERKNSCTRYLPQSGFAVEDDDRAVSYEHHRRHESLQLAPLQSAAPVFRDPDYRTEKPQLLTEPAPQSTHYHHHHSMPQSASLPAGQRPLPAYQNLTLPSGQATSPAIVSPSSRQLPSPIASTADPKSPQARTPVESPRDSRMNLNHIL